MLVDCLRKQTFKDFEWVIATNRFDFFTKITKVDCPLTLVFDPPKRKGDYYRLNGAWNRAFKNTHGDLVVSIVDQTWIAPNCLEKLWTHYEINSKSCISAVGHQYKDEVDGKPENLVWRDPRSRTDQGTFYRVRPTEMEFCVASVPLKALYDVGGIDEEWDKYAALSEKELMVRIEKAGYELYLDQTNEYRAIHHPRLSEEWDERYKAGCKFYEWCLRKVLDGTRLKLDYL